MFERRLYHHLDWILLGTIFSLCFSTPSDLHLKDHIIPVRWD